MRIVLLFCFLLSFESCATTASRRDCAIDSRKMTDAEMTVEVSIYHSAIPSDKSILLMPPTGGTNYIDKSYAKNFCAAGFDVYILDSWSRMTEPGSADLELHQRLYNRGQQAISTVLAQVKSPKIGMLGTSLGGLHAAVAASFQPRLNAVFIITAGAPITEVIMTSDQKAMQDLFAVRKIKYGFKDRAENLHALEKAFLLEPMKIGPGYRNKALGMAVATEDETVPTPSQKKLQAFWQPGKVITLPNGHFWGIVNTWLFHEDEVLNFFEENLKN